MTRSVAVIALSEAGRPTAEALVAALPGAELHGLRRRLPSAEHTFDDPGAHIRALYADGTAIIGVCSSGILIRALAPNLADKRTAPPVIAVAADGSAVVPLLGGHHDGNRLARAVGQALGAFVAATTASDAVFGVALDEPPPGWRLANPEHHKDFVAAAMAGDRIRLEGKVDWLEDCALPFDRDGSLTIVATDQVVAGAKDCLVYHPTCLAIGVGCERGTEPGEVIDLVRECLSSEGLSADAVGGLYSLDLKADEPALHALADNLGVEVRTFAAEQLEQEAPRLATPSEVVFREVGCHGVAEGAALAAVGSEGDLIMAKRKSARATCGIARSANHMPLTATGRRQGRLAVVGTGPGAVDWMTGAVRRLIEEADDLVGYGLYLDLVTASADERRHDFPIGAEADRVAHALDLAAQGHRVVLVSSGDPGIYAMAALVFEQIDRRERPDWRRVQIRVEPGISALQAAAARAGAPLGHDFCAISLSDLLTPWEQIERRIEAAAAADFVVAFYNPVSKRRHWQLARAREILLRERGPETPVIVARNLGREGECVRQLTLADLAPEDVDMLTVVLVGASTTRALDIAGTGWVYTPRGYGAGGRIADEPEGKV